MVWDDGLRDVFEPCGLVHLQRAGSSEARKRSRDCIMVDGLHPIVCVRWTQHILLRDRVHPDVSGGAVPGRDLSVLFLDNLSHLHVCLQTALLPEAQQQDGSVVLRDGVASLHRPTDNDGEGLSSVLDYGSHKLNLLTFVRFVCWIVSDGTFWLTLHQNRHHLICENDISS